MKKIFSTQTLPWLMCIGLIGYLILSKAILPKMIRESSSTSYNEKNLGLSLLWKIFQKSNPSSISLNRSPFLAKNDLKNSQSLLISSPLFTPSARESAVIQQFVRSGGTLLIFTSSEPSLHTMTPLLKELNVPTPQIEENPHFINQQTESTLVTHDTSLFKQGEALAIYSDIQFKDDSCTRLNRDRCFLKIHSVGSGQVYISLGIPLLSNTLISRESNQLAAFRILKNHSPLMIDEYHHYFSQYGAKELLQSPQFSIPIFGFIALTLIFFIFSESPLHASAPLHKTQQLSKSFHDLGQKILHAQLQTNSGLQSAKSLHTRILERLLPTKRDEIQSLAKDQQAPTLQTLRKLISFHRLQRQFKRGLK